MSINIAIFDLYECVSTNSLEVMYGGPWFESSNVAQKGSKLQVT